MNILTFDIEEWYAEMVLLGDRQDKYVQYDKCLNDVVCIFWILLSLLNDISWNVECELSWEISLESMISLALVVG